MRMDYAKSTRAIRLVIFGLLVVLAMQTLAQTPSTTTPVPYSEWYTNRDMYKLSIFGFPPESKNRMNSAGYNFWVAEQEQNWRAKCTVTPDVKNCTKLETAWYYNNQIQLCTTFNGCANIINGYQSKDECVKVCEQYSPNKPLPTFKSVFTTVTESSKKPVDVVISERQTPNIVNEFTTIKSVPVTDPSRFVTAGIPEKVTQKEVQVPQTGEYSCGHKLHRLAGVYLQQHAGVPRPVSLHDNVTKVTEHTIGVTIDKLAMELFTDCSLVNISRTKWLSTEVEYTPDGGMFIYQVGIQTMTFVHP